MNAIVPLKHIKIKGKDFISSATIGEDIFTDLVTKLQMPIAVVLLSYQNIVC